MKIAITGGIGSGKSYVCERLQAMGINVYDCDAAAKRLIHTSGDIRRALTELIGQDAYTADGRLNKQVVAQFLLSSGSNANAIDGIVHPAVACDFKSSSMEWMECAILYESGFDRLVNKVIVVTAPEDLRIARIVARDGITTDKAKEWLARQWPQDEVRRRADYEIINDGVHDVDAQINEITNKLQQERQCYRKS